MSKEEWKAFKEERDFLKNQAIHRSRSPKVKGKGRTKQDNRLTKTEKEGRSYKVGITTRTINGRPTYGQGDQRWSRIWNVNH